MRTKLPRAPQGAPPLNFHHLQYFWAVATDGNLTRTAARLHVAQSAVSAQIRQLEAQLGQALFVREGRRLALTEAGQVTLQHAQRIFEVGGELLAALGQGRAAVEPLRVGAVATLSRNFQESFVKPLLGHDDARLRLVSGGLEELLGALEAHQLDVVLSNRPVRREEGQSWRCRRMARQGVSLVGKPRKRRGFRFPHDLSRWPLILPGPNNELRTEFDALCERLELRVRVLAEVDDMATLRLLARDAEAVTLLPTIVVRDELRQGRLAELCVVPGLFETFYAITVDRQFEHPLLRELLGRKEAEVLEMG
jgi:LysR family transcriptional activator of nhaA